MFILFQKFSVEIIYLALNSWQYCNEGLGECTEFAWCSNSTVFNDGGGHINVRFNIELETDACHYMEMCCDPEDVIKKRDEREVPHVASPHTEIGVDPTSRNPGEETETKINGNATTKEEGGGSSREGVKIKPTEIDVTRTNNGGNATTKGGDGLGGSSRDSKKIESTETETNNGGPTQPGRNGGTNVESVFVPPSENDTHTSGNLVIPIASDNVRENS